MLCNISQNAMGEPGGTLPGPAGGGYPGQGGTLPGGNLAGRVPWLGGYPVRTTKGVLATRRAVCLLRSRRRTFLLIVSLDSIYVGLLIEYMEKVSASLSSSRPLHCFKIVFTNSYLSRGLHKTFRRC